MALAAEARHVLSLVLREGITIGTAGIIIGLPATYPISRTLATCCSASQ
jgi:ABC-type antimicrobial peptide transport system permease subunit